ncbi:hypothetical protein EI94DRAFT_1789122 [Lactarius quietus]|nr:hypothetical protein EI94DRAFT_1789122 [Lactarius quietus]
MSIDLGFQPILSPLRAASEDTHIAVLMVLNDIALTVPIIQNEGMGKDMATDRSKWATQIYRLPDAEPSPNIRDSLALASTLSNTATARKALKKGREHHNATYVLAPMCATEDFHLDAERVIHSGQVRASHVRSTFHCPPAPPGSGKWMRELSWILEVFMAIGNAMIQWASGYYKGEFWES